MRRIFINTMIAAIIIIVLTSIISTTMTSVHGIFASNMKILEGLGFPTTFPESATNNTSPFSILTTILIMIFAICGLTEYLFRK